MVLDTQDTVLMVLDTQVLTLDTVLDQLMVLDTQVLSLDTEDTDQEEVMLQDMLHKPNLKPPQFNKIPPMITMNEQPYSLIECRLFSIILNEFYLEHTFN